MKVLSDDKIHVVLAIYDPKGTYSRHAGVAMASMFSNTTSSVCVHILHDETLNEGNRKNFIELAEKYDKELNFISVTEHIEKLRVVIDVDYHTGGFSRGTLFRYFVQDLLPVDRAIYLDCDVIVNMDIKELWDIELGGCKIGAVYDGKIESKRRVFLYRYAGIDMENYFNSGVMLFDFKKMRGNVNICAEALEFFRRYPYAIHPGQDCLNLIFQKSALIIDRKFNYRKSGADYSDMTGKLWHLTSLKPWEQATGLPTDALYWRYFAMTPWCGDLVTDITKALAGSHLTHAHSRHCFKALWQQLKRNLSPKPIAVLFKIAVIWYDMIYRVRKKWGYT